MAAINPVVLSTPSPAGLALQQILAADSVTWKKGEFLYLSSGTVTPVSTTTGSDATELFIAAEDQDTSTSSTTVWVRRLERGTRLKMYATNNGTAATLADANVGVNYEVYTASNITYIDVNATSTPTMVVERLGTDVEPEKAPTTAPEWAIVRFDPVLS